MNQAEALLVARAIAAYLGPPGVIGPRDKTQDPITAELADCLAKYPGTVGINDCLDIANQKFDRVLNLVYQYDLAHNNAAAQSALRESQRTWIKFRDAALAAFWKNNRQTGTGAVAIGSSQNLTMLRERISELWALEDHE